MIALRSGWLRPFAFVVMITCLADFSLLTPPSARAQSSGCAKSATAQPNAGQSSAIAGAKQVARMALLGAIKPHIDFVTFRRIVLAQGWAPIPHTPLCLNQIDAGLCAKLPEVFDTSSGPIEYNEMSYRHLLSGERLHVVVTGDITVWSTPDAKRELSVDSWDFGGADPNG